ncbi:hypothetical protein, partial [Corynebacterium gottingense]|uniref:hypothetical protein n=1 Tax=Corynebacterium gottingense TaxID=2041036 RepID=UPI001FC9B673
MSFAEVLVDARVPDSFDVLDAELTVLPVLSVLSAVELVALLDGASLCAVSVSSGAGAAVVLVSSSPFPHAVSASEAARRAGTRVRRCVTGR